MTRTCNTCRAVKPLQDFVKDPTRPAGRKNICRPCDAVRCRNYYARTAGERRRWARDYSHSHWRAKKQKVLGTKRYIAEDLLRKAVKSGKKIKPSKCEGCGLSFPRRRIHGHHPDYSKPLEVKWLCAGCHAKEHRRFK